MYYISEYLFYVKSVIWRRKWQPTSLENLMDRRAWQATAHGVARVGHDLATKLPPPII